MRALIVTNMYPSDRHPARGSFVRDQVRALARLGDVEVEVFAFEPGGARPYIDARRELVRRRHDGASFDVVHAHFGLSAWPAHAVRARVHALTLHGTDLAHPRSRLITLSALRFIDLVAAVSEELAESVPSWSHSGEVAVLPAGVDVERFHPMPRTEARAALGLPAHGPLLLFAADPARPEKRHDRAVEVAAEVPLLALGEVAPDQVPLWVNAVNAVLVPSEREGFGLAVLEALACNVPVLATPRGVAAEALSGIGGCYCGPYELATWRNALEPHLHEDDSRVQGRARAEEYSCDRMAARVRDAWRALLEA